MLHKKDIKAWYNDFNPHPYNFQLQNLRRIDEQQKEFGKALRIKKCKIK